MGIYVLMAQTPQTPAAILFDSDGTLTDSEQLFFDVTCSVLAGAGFRLSAEQWARWYLGEGLDSAGVFERIGVPAPRITELRECRNRVFYQAAELGVPLRPFVRETLEWLRGRVRLAVVTSGSRRHFERVHRRTDLTPFFDEIVTHDDCPKEKPDPAAYELALTRLGLRAEDCWAVEDAPRGARAAAAAGLRCFLVPTPLTDLSLCPAECVRLRHVGDLKEEWLWSCAAEICKGDVRHAKP
jgi:HAD superfamily hydrolase (TIGR01509 family)